MISVLLAASLAVAPIQAEPYGMAVAGSANHAQPIPGEEQVYHWTVRNTGTEKLTAAWFAVRPPADWKVAKPDACRLEDDRVVCPLGGLKPDGHRQITLRMTVPARPRFGPVTIPAWTGATTDGGPFTGPEMSLKVNVVKNRLSN